jgi:hypothetical protein
LESKEPQFKSEIPDHFIKFGPNMSDHDSACHW